ncbi:MAG: transcription antitermination factor NusB [Christensenellales bacterium]
MSRKVARENTYKLIFEYLFGRTPNARTYSVLSCGDMDESDVEYMQQVYYGVIENFDELNGIITKYSEGFALDRIFKPDLSALLLAVYELKYMKDIPSAVSINEAVELVKRYSTEKSNVFVNGILSAVNKDMNK